MRNALSIAICFLVFQPGALTGQTAWSGWDTPAGSRLGRPGVIAPVLKAAPLPSGLVNRQPGRLTSTVDVLVTIEKDGRVNPIEVLSPSRKRDAIEKQAWQILKTWTFEAGQLKNKPTRVAAILSVPFGDGEPFPPPTRLPGFAEFAGDLRRADAPGVTPPIRLMGQDPAYPDGALAARLEGEVSIAFVIQTDGHIGATRILKSVGKAADEAALNCLKDWLYWPALADAQPVATPAVATMAFRLK